MREPAGPDGANYLVVDESYWRYRAKARRRPSWWLRRRAGKIGAARPRPTDVEIGELKAIRFELRWREDHGWWWR